MLRRKQSDRPVWRGPVAVRVVAGALACASATTLAAPALAARLVGGHRQAAIVRAFNAHGAHRHQVVVSVRSSTVSPAWAVAESVRPEAGGRSGGRAANLKPSFAYFHQVGGAQRSGNPPGPVRADLSRAFKLAVVYSGSGSETITYTHQTNGVCAAAGGNVDQQSDTVSPMSWNIRYVVDLNRLEATVRDGRGTILVPSVTLSRGGSSVAATEQVSRSTVDLSCNGQTTTNRCSTQYTLGSPGASGWLSLAPGTGLEVGIPTTQSASGSCDPDVFALGPSLWASDAATARVSKLGFLGGGLPGNPYAPITVSWPANSALADDGSLVSPCQGNPACVDSLHWKATVRLQQVTGG
jgi:hypothetical protein